MRGRHRRNNARPKIGLILALALVVGAIAAPAGATKPNPDDPNLESGHKIWICHATSSLSNPYVKILIDIAAWDIADPDSNDHGPMHHLREKNGIIWGDYALVNPDDECGLDIPPPPGAECPDGIPADYVVSFDGTKIYPINPTQTVAVAIPAGTYNVTLISGDYQRGTEVQDHEQWYLGGDTPSGPSNDLPDFVLGTGEIEAVTGEVTGGLTVVFDSDVTSVTAHHYSVYSRGRTDDSVVPEFACLTEEGQAATGAEL